MIMINETYRLDRDGRGRQTGTEPSDWEEEQ